MCTCFRSFTWSLCNVSQARYNIQKNIASTVSPGWQPSSFAESHSHFICKPAYTSLLSLLHCYFSGWESDSPAVWKSRYCQEASLNINEFIKNEGSLKYYHNLNVSNKNFLSLNQHILHLSVWLSFPVIASDELYIWEICTKYTQNNLSGKDFFHTSPNLPKYI